MRGITPFYFSLITPIVINITLYSFKKSVTLSFYCFYKGSVGVHLTAPDGSLQPGQRPTPYKERSDVEHQWERCGRDGRGKMEGRGAGGGSLEHGQWVNTFCREVRHLVSLL